MINNRLKLLAFDGKNARDEVKHNQERVCIGIE